VPAPALRPLATDHRAADGSDWRRLFAARATRGGDELTAILSLADARDVITFSGGFPATEALPVAALRRLTAELLDEDPAGALQYSPTEGVASVRATVADLLDETQGHRPDLGDVLVTSGGIEALQLLSRVLLEPADEVLVEAPSYLGALMAFRGFEARVTGVPMDELGLRVDELEASLSRHRPKLLYVIPDHQNPTGLSLAAERRAALVATCRRHGVLLVEDVAYRELGFAGHAAPSLLSLGPDVVVQIGTFSKIFAPGLRLGWAVGPRQVVAAMTAAKQNSDQCAGAFGQRLMERYVRGGHLQAHLVDARELYRQRAAAMLGALEQHMPPGVTWTRPAGGFFVWLTAGPDVDTRSLTQAAARLGVAYVPGAPFYADSRGSNQLRLAFSRATESQIAEGIARLGALLRQPVSGRDA
jgi:2-aminoadipate transaminase